MAHSKSEHSLDTTWNEAMKLLRNQFQLKLYVEVKLKEFSKEKRCYANCMLSKQKGAMDRNGSSISESNQSSVKSHLNDGDVFSNQCRESPLSIVKDLTLR